jgi:Sulfotransferase family
VAVRTSRSTAPVFVTGSARSGTTLFYDMLLSAGGFAVYLAESNVFNLLAPHYGNLRRRSDREKLLSVWLGSKLFRATGLDPIEIERDILENCCHAGDFLRIVMNAIARRQGMQRWAENCVEGSTYLPAIKTLIPEALVIHMIRDGRDVATSLHNTRYVRTLPWRSQMSLAGAGVYWEWVVQQGCGYGRSLGNDYLEVHFEDLINSPQETLKTVARFLDHELDYDRIRQVGYGSVSKPNTFFVSGSREKFSPIGRWKKAFSASELRRFECMVGPTLLEHGYALASRASVAAGAAHQSAMTMETKITRQFYRTLFVSKERMKNNPLVTRLRPLTPTRLDRMTQAEDHAPDVRIPPMRTEETTAVSQPSPGSSR